MRSKIERNVALNLKIDGKTYSEISSTLGVTRDAARNLCRYQLKTIKKKTGCKSKINSKQQYQIRREVSNLKNAGQKVNTTKIIKNCNLDISKTTCWRELNKSGFKFSHIKKQVYLEKKHKIKRMELITKWFSTNHNWGTTIFTDEKRFSLDGPDDWSTYIAPGEKMVRQKRQCDGGGLMVWLMAMPNGLVSHKIIRGKFKALDYIELLKNQLIPIAKLNYGDDFILQEDNAPVHKAKIVKKYLQESHINVLDWPAKSPDMNIVEDIWSIVSQMIYDGPQYQCKKTLEKAIDAAFLVINGDKRQCIKDLYSSITPRLCKILSKNGSLYNK